MLRLSRFLPSASRRGFDIKEAVWSGSLTFQQAISTSAANLDENSSGRKFASYTVFKGKAALSIHPVLPSFSKMESGASRMNRNGSVMLTFFPAVGQRKYDYKKKHVKLFLFCSFVKQEEELSRECEVGATSELDRLRSLSRTIYLVWRKSFRRGDRNRIHHKDVC